MVATKLVLQPLTGGANSDTSTTISTEGITVSKVSTIDQRILFIQTLKRSLMSDILGDKDLLFNGEENMDITEKDMTFMINGGQ